MVGFRSDNSISSQARYDHFDTLPYEILGFRDKSARVQPVTIIL